MSQPKKIITLLAVTITTTQTTKEAKEEAKEDFAAAEAGVIKEIKEIILQLLDYHLKKNYKKGAYISTLSLKRCIEPYNSRKSMSVLPILPMHRQGLQVLQQCNLKQ